MVLKKMEFNICALVDTYLVEIAKPQKLIKLKTAMV